MDNQAAHNETNPATSWDAEKDDKLLSRMANGSEDEQRQAFAAFHRRHSQYLYGICYNVVNRYKFGFFDEDDLFQSTMIRAFKSAKTFKPDGLTESQELEDKADAWLGEIAENLVFDWLRRRPRCVSLDPELLEEGEDPLEVAEVPFEEEKEGLNLIREAIDTLTPVEQAVIWAVNQFYERRVHQRTPTEELDEIVSGLGITKDNFRKIKERARKKIFKYLVDRQKVTATE